MCGPNFGPMVYAFCLLQRARWAATGCIFHSCFLALGARMLVSQYHGYVLLSACVGSSTLAARIGLCFVAPKQGPDSGPKNGATILKLAAQLPNVWSQFWAHGVCVLPSAKSALSCDRLHLPFMFSCAWCQDAGFTVSRICAAVSLRRQ